MVQYLHFWILEFRVWRWPGNRAVIVADRGTVRPPPPHGWTVARLAVRLAVHGWPSRLHGWPCGRPCTVGRPGWPADPVGRPTACSWPCTVGRPTVFLAVHGWPCSWPCTVGRPGWPADRVPGRTRLAVFLAVHGWPTRLAGRPCSWPCTVGRHGRPGWPADRFPSTVGRPVGRPAVFLAMHGWPTRLAGRPCSWPCTVGRPGWPADRVPGRARLACTVDRFKIGMVTKKAIGNKGIRRVRCIMQWRGTRRKAWREKEKEDEVAARKWMVYNDQRTMCSKSIWWLLQKLNEISW